MAAKDNLTGRQERFCREYAASGNAYQSGIAAGYSEKYCCGRLQTVLLEMPSIKKRLQELYAERDSQLIADSDELKKRLTAIVRQSVTDDNIVIEGTGNGCSKARHMDRAPSFKDQLKAIELLARMGGMFTDKINMEGSVPVVLKGYDDVKD